MKAVFIDTYYYLALLNPADKAHAQAVHIARTSFAPLVTTAWILIEVADALAEPRSRPRFCKLYESIQRDPALSIVPASQALFDQGLALFRARPDKAWGLTDCISFAVMHEMGLNDALTGDQHFVQAGFSALMLA